MKIRYKIMLLFTIMVIAIISALEFSVHYFATLERRAIFIKRLQARANYNTQLYALMGDSAMPLLRRMDTSSITGMMQPRAVGLYTLAGKELYRFDVPGTPPLAVSPEVIKEAGETGEKYFTMDRRDALALKRLAPHRKFIVVVSGYDDDGWERLQKLDKILMTSLLASVVLTALVGFLFTGQILKPISLIIQEVKDISSYNLSHRLQVGKGQDELSRLASTFNELLGRIQESFATQRRFISNASHELSTPLTSLSSQVEVALQKERTAEEYKQVLASVLEDVQQMRQLTRSLLEIAKSGSQGSIELNEVRVDELLMKVTADVKKLSPDYRVELNFGEFPEDEKDFVVFGNSELLYIAIKNIVENGCKYSPDRRSVVDLYFADHKVFVQVVNHGDEIEEAEIEHIFRPFYRGQGARDSRGFGLGLALAQRITAMHKGAIRVDSDVNRGTNFTIELPAIKIFN